MPRGRGDGGQGVGVGGSRAGAIARQQRQQFGREYQGVARTPARVAAALQYQLRGRERAGEIPIPFRGIGYRPPGGEFQGIGYRPPGEPFQGIGFRPGQRLAQPGQPGRFGPGFYARLGESESQMFGSRLERNRRRPITGYTGYRAPPGGPFEAILPLEFSPSGGGGYPGGGGGYPDYFPEFGGYGGGGGGGGGGGSPFTENIPPWFLGLHNWRV